MLKAAIHGTWCTNWKPASSRWNPQRSAIARISGGTLNATAVARIRLWFRDGRHSTTAIPMSGTKIMRLRISVIVCPSSRSRRHRPRPVEEHAAHNPEDDDVEIGAERPRLDVPHAPADELRDVADEIHEPVHHVEVEEPAEARPAAHDGGREVHDAVDDVQVEPRR